MSLISNPAEAAIHNLCLGTSSEVIEHLSNRILELLRHELIFVTCFWAPSPSQRAIRRLLATLSAHAIRNRTRYCVRICLSSVSLLQKLTHTWSEKGYVYPSNKHESSLQLPAPEDVPGLDLKVKSVFLLPFSVMHPKYVIIDRTTALLPSCNVSWEEWMEGGLEFRGSAVLALFNTWRSFWASYADFAVEQTLPTSAAVTATPASAW